MSVTSVVSNHNFVGLLVANTLLAAAFPIQLVLGSLGGLMLAPNDGLATLPSSVQTLAGLIAAGPFSLFMGRFGRRSGFALGSFLTAVGALVASYALFFNSFEFLCAGHLFMGAGWASFQYFRFAAAEIVDAKWRPVSISLLLTSGLVAAIIGPQIFVLTKDAMAPISFAGAYFAIVGISLVGVVPLAWVRIPPPGRSTESGKKGTKALGLALRRPPVRRAIATASVSQGIMVFLMIPTPIAIVACGFTDILASDVVRWHIVAMFAPSFFTGFLIQRFSASVIAICGIAVLFAAATIAALGLSAAHFYIALIVLGIGWNFGFIGATSMLADAVSEEEKAMVQGANDTIIALVSTICAFAAGLVMAGFGWIILAITSGVIALMAGVVLYIRVPANTCGVMK